MKALEGVKVVEMATFVAVPSCGLSMCDFMMYSHSYSEPRTTIPSGDRISLIKSLLLADIGSGSVYLLIKSFLLERLRFPEHIRNGEDLWFVLRLFSSVNNASKVDEP